MNDRKPIVAQSTPKGTGALALIRISGEDAFTVFLQIVMQTERFKNAPPRKISLYTLMDHEKKKVLDEVTAIKYTSPRSFTGENMIEIICHGGEVIIREIINALIKNGAQQASRGAFTRRALENGKIDLLKAEAIQGIIESTNEPDRLCAQRMYDGKINALLSVKDTILKVQTELDAEIEFGEEERISDTRESGRETILRIISDLEKEIRLREKITNLIGGIRIIITGPTNAGKSTLFNTILGFQRALVHHEPGTTRDMVSERMLIDDHEIKLIDCAGIRETSNDVERQGIIISRSAINTAHLILWVTAANETLSENEKQEIKANVFGKRAIGIINKCDIEDGASKVAIFKEEGITHCLISLKQGKNVDSLLTIVKKEIDFISSSIEMPEILLNKRFEELGKKIMLDLLKADKEWNRTEIAAHYLKKAYSHFEEIFGANNNEEILNRIFDNFCIGK
jgi:tRNA modification GTPase